VGPAPAGTFRPGRIPHGARIDRLAGD